MPDPDIATLEVILDLLLTLDGRIARNDQRIGDIKSENKGLKEYRDTLCSRGTKALAAASIKATVFGGPQSTVWRLSGGAFEQVMVTPADSVPVEVPGEPVVEDEPKITALLTASAVLDLINSGMSNAAIQRMYPKLSLCDIEAYRLRHSLEVAK